MKKQYQTPQIEVIELEIASILTLSAETSKYDKDNPRPISIQEATDKNNDGNDDEEATAKRWRPFHWDF